MTVSFHQRVDGVGRRILVIDDDLAIRILLQAVLERLNFDVDLAGDGAEGLAKVEKNDYELVLLDLMMPIINGYDFLETVHGGTRKPRHIIVFTAAGPRGIERIPPHRVCNAILKPFDISAFVEMITFCTNGHQPSG